MKLTRFDILKYPHVTEKATLVRDDNEGRVVVFKVKKQATKRQISEAIEKIFKVRVEKVRTANFQGKLKRQGRNVGRRPGWKKAYVTLREGEKPIEFFEGV